MKSNIALIAFISLMVSTPPTQAQFFYSSEGSTPLLVSTEKVVVKFEPFVSEDQIISSNSSLTEILTDSILVDGFNSIGVQPGVDILSLIGLLNHSSGIRAAEPYYMLQDSTPYPLGERFVVGFEAEVTRHEIDSIALFFGAEVLRQIENMQNVWVLRNATAPQTRLLDMANQFHNLPNVRYSHPLFGVQYEANSSGLPYKLYDRYHAHQTHIKQGIGSFNQASVWDFYGVKDTVVVAVIDNGVIAHEDLPASRILPGHNFRDTTQPNNPAPQQDDYHGMACAGIIAAEHTTDSVAGLSASSGVISMYDAVRILPIKIYQEGIFASVDNVAASIAWAAAHGADVISCSWNKSGCNDPGDPVVDDAINQAVLYGRSGRGCPVFFSSGNSAPGCNVIATPARHPLVCAVGAVDLQGIRMGFSNYGSDLDLVAPSGNGCSGSDVWTIDQMGQAGANPLFPPSCASWDCATPNDVDYNCHFGGTSASCPQVAGAAALLLAQDSMLSYGAVYYLLTQSADTVSATGVSYGRKSLQYGWGRMDAYAAVLAISHGDPANDGRWRNPDITDLQAMIDHLFFSSPITPDPLLGDMNCDSAFDIADLNWMIDELFFGGPIAINPCFKR